MDIVIKFHGWFAIYLGTVLDILITYLLPISKTHEQTMDYLINYLLK